MLTALTVLVIPQAPLSFANSCPRRPTLLASTSGSADAPSGPDAWPRASGLLPAFPLPILAGLLATAGVMHIGLLRDLHGARDRILALFVGIVGFELDLTIGLGLGLALCWLPIGAVRLRLGV